MRKHSVECSHGSRKLGSRRCCNGYMDQGINRWVRNAPQVCRAWCLGRLGSEVLEQLAARRIAGWNTQATQLEIKLVHTLLIQSSIDIANSQLDAEFAQRNLHGSDQSIGGRLRIEILDLERFALGIAQGTVAIRPTRVAQQLLGFAQVAT